MAPALFWDKPSSSMFLVKRLKSKINHRVFGSKYTIAAKVLNRIA
jgi:hypothetical protein